MRKIQKEVVPGAAPTGTPVKQKASKGAGHRLKCAHYKSNNSRMKNKLANMLRHVKRQGTCKDFDAQFARVKSLVAAADQRPIYARLHVTM